MRADSDDWSKWSTMNETVKQQSTDEYQLLRDLMTNYDPAALPSLNTSDAVRVQMGIALFQIRELVGKANFSSKFNFSSPENALSPL